MMQRRIMALALLAVLISSCGSSSPASSAVPSPGAQVAAVPTQPPAATPAPAGRIAEGGVGFETEDHVKLSGTIFGTGETAVILAHMNNSDQSAWQPFAKELAQQGFTALTFDFRGFGKSGGHPQVGLLDRDVRAAAAFLRDKGFPRVVCVGASMGGTACAKAALSPGLDALVVISSPLSMSPPLRLGTKDLPQLALPKLFVVSKGDADFVESVKLMYQLSPDPKEITVLPGAAHGTNIFGSSDGAALSELLLKFLQGLQS
jgi:alpha-beta hydrolase superfamily lysophospholipase